MSGPISLWFDFASPYAYFASTRIDEIAAEAGRSVDWKPILMWAVLKAHGIAPPMDAPVKRDYFLNDMRRSAAFYGLPYRDPLKLPLSSHLAARLWYGAAGSAPEKARALIDAIFTAFFVEHRDISDESTLASIAAAVGIPETEALDLMTGQAGRSQLEAAVGDAVKAKVVGSPYFRVDGEGFFGVDRLPQLRWFLHRGE